MPITSTWRVVNTNNSSVRWDLSTTTSDGVSTYYTMGNPTYYTMGTSTYYTIKSPVYYTEENMKNWNDRFEYYLGDAFKKKVKFIQEEFDV